MFDHQLKIIFWQLKILNVAIRPKYECVARPGNASEFYFRFHIHKLEADYQRKRGGRQVLSCKCCTCSWRFLHDLARFEWLARAHCPAGASNLVHFVVKIAVEKVGSEKISMLLALLCKINFSVLFL